jgi:hypothetical protein
MCRLALKRPCCRPGLWAALAVLSWAVLALGATAASTSTPADPAVVALSAAWREMVSAAPGSSQASQARARVDRLVQQIPRTSRPEAMAALMDLRSEPDGTVNLAAIAVFGTDALDPNALAALLRRPSRGPAQNHLLCGCYALLNKALAHRPFSPAYPQALRTILQDYLVSLRDKELSDDEQDLLIELCRQAIADVAKPSTPTEQALATKMALKTFYNKALPGPLEASVKDWLRIMNADEDLSWSEQQLLLLCHWDPARQWSAAIALGRTTAANRDIPDALEKLLGDSRNSVRAHAAVALRFSSDPLSEPAVEKLIKAMKADRSAQVRREAASALAGHAGDAAAGKALPEFLAIMENPTAPEVVLVYTWQCVKRFVPAAGAADRRRICRAAAAQLPRRGAPILEVLKALGPDATPAAAAMEKYRAVASPSEREMIDALLKRLGPSSVPSQPATGK